MKKIIILIILILASLLVQTISVLPWWSFLVVIFLLGIILPLEKWKISSFLSGFIAGFLIWLLATLYFETIYGGEITNKIGKMASVPCYFLYVIIGVMGGGLTGLALYSGFLLRRGKETPHLESDL